jgi:hypothetical protein
VTETAVGADLLEALEVLTKLAVQAVGDNLRVLAVGDVALSVQEPGGDLVLGRGLEDGDDALKLFGGEFTSTILKFCQHFHSISHRCFGEWRDFCNVSSLRSLPAHLATSTAQNFCARPSTSHSVIDPSTLSPRSPPSTEDIAGVARLLDCIERTAC